MKEGALLITGTSRGIGRRLAERYVADGRRVVGCSRGPAAPPALTSALLPRSGQHPEEHLHRVVEAVDQPTHALLTAEQSEVAGGPAVRHDRDARAG